MLTEASVINTTLYVVVNIYCITKNLTSVLRQQDFLWSIEWKTHQIEVIGAEQVDEAYERVLRSDVRYRFVIDISTL